MVLLRSMIAEGYGDARTLERRARKMEDWLANPSLMEADDDAEYTAVIEIDLADVRAHRLRAQRSRRCPPAVHAVAGDKVDEVFIGSCMTNIGHFARRASCCRNTRAASPPACGCAAHPHGRASADGGRLLQYLWRRGSPHRDAGLLLCMGNQARVAANSTVLSQRPPATSPTAWATAPTST